MSKITISAIVASAKNRVIGDGEQLFWKISEDFRRLKEINQVMCYTEIGRLQKYSEYSLFTNSGGEKKLWDWVRLAEGKSFKRIRLEEHKDIWPAFKKLFGGKT